MRHPGTHLLPEEDVLDDPDDDDEADPTLPGDLWFRQGFPRRIKAFVGAAYTSRQTFDRRIDLFRN